MSIPLDRLYHYLSDLCNDDILIYRWYPHGSKNLDDLQLLDDRNIPSGHLDVLKINNLICHDQEPLNYNLYSNEQFLEQIKIKAKSRIEQERCKDIPKIPSWCRSEQFQRLLVKAHLRNMVRLTPNLNDYTLLCHSEKNSEQLKLYEQNYFIGVYYWSHAIIARDWFRYAEIDKALVPNFENISNDFLIYNRAWSGSREYRLKFVELLANTNVLSCCNIKFNAYDTNMHYTDHKFTNREFQINRTDLEFIITENTADSNASADYVSADYQTSAIEIVLETLFDDTRQHLTEKILRPIACGRPFILAGTPGCLQYLRDYGFKTFSGLINEEYDTVNDPIERLNLIAREMSRISSLSVGAKKDLWKKLYAIAEFNKERFFSEQFHEFVSKEFTENYKRAVDFSKQHVTGRWTNMFFDSALIEGQPQKSPEYIELLNFLRENGTLNCHHWPDPYD